MFSITSINKKTVISLLIILLFLVEIIPTLYRFLDNFSVTRIVGSYKILFQILILFFIDYSNLNKKLLFFMSILVIIFSVSLLLNPLLINDFNWLLLNGSIYYLDRYMFVFLFGIMLYTRIDKFIIINNSLKYLEWILILNSALIVIGYLFDLKIFESYIRSSRFGYDGIFNKVNEVSYIYSIYLIYLYHCSFITKTKHWSLFFSIAIVSLFLGTKTILLFLSLLFIFHFIFVLKNNKRFKLLIIVLVLVFIVFFEKIIRFLFDLFPFWDHLQEKYSTLTLLFSLRDVLFSNALDHIGVYWDNINYFIGGAFYDRSFAITQMDGPDLVLFFGFLGTIVYLIIFWITYFKKNNIILNGLISIILICGLLGGGLLMSGMSMVLLLLVSCKLNEVYKLKSSNV